MAVAVPKRQVVSITGTRPGRRPLSIGLALVGAGLVVASYLGPAWFRIQSSRFSFRQTAAEVRYLIPSKRAGLERIAHSFGREMLSWSGLVLVLVTIAVMLIAVVRPSAALRIASIMLTVIVVSVLVAAAHLAKTGRPYVGGVHAGLGIYLALAGLIFGGAGVAIAAPLPRGSGPT